MMHLLDGILILMLLVAIAFIALPLAKHHQIFSKTFFISAAFIVLFAAGMYVFLGDYRGLSQWMSQGREHYQLMSTFESLGGVDGAISKIENRLLENPKDAKGWFILGKLYLSKHEDAKANAAFENAHKLAPE